MWKVISDNDSDMLKCYYGMYTCLCLRGEVYAFFLLRIGLWNVAYAYFGPLFITC
jgi:hypothetical protein